MAITRQKKEEIVKHLNEAFSDAEVAVFTAFEGMSVAKMTELRKQITESGGSYQVMKKTLLERSLRDLKIEGVDAASLQGEIGVAFGKDVAAITKAVYSAHKESGILQILIGIVGDKILTSGQIMQIATLPSREELLARALSSINAPLVGMVNVLSGNVRGLVYALRAIQNTKS